ncbi:hypothetical protein BaRGS_00027649 [Batillaria attramentaria]|uniref:G-protein coupled receptors family 1 profile domain-containing protein n=1 Tax=Batillaria attramentaria TaxID=370345 RepID=A0ABD0K236_9CAEN
MSLGHTFAIYGNNDALTSTDNYASASASADNVTAPPVIPDGCFAAVSDISPGVEPTKGISASSLKVLEIIVYLGAMPVLTLVGCVTNTLSCVVFYRLGVKKGINLCLLLLSASDLLFLLSQTAVRSSRVMLTLTASARGISQWEYTVVTFHLLRKVCTYFVSVGSFGSVKENHRMRGTPAQLFLTCILTTLRGSSDSQGAHYNFARPVFSVSAAKLCAQGPGTAAV